MADSDLSEVWARSLDGLADLQIQPHQRAWLKLTRPLGLVENTALIATPNEFVKEQLETRLRPLVTQALSQQLGRDIQLAVTVDPSPQLGTAPAPTTATWPPSPPRSGLRGVPGGTPRTAARDSRRRRIPPRRRVTKPRTPTWDVPAPSRPKARPAYPGWAGPG